jgi:hypothetical protein
MVMRNRHDGASSSGWWDDLPPAVRRRIAHPPHSLDEEPETIASREPSAGRPSILRDLSRLAVLFLLVAIANLLFILIALSFLIHGAPGVR